jgi:hypothetical protein
MKVQTGLLSVLLIAGSGASLLAGSASAHMCGPGGSGGPDCYVLHKADAAVEDARDACRDAAWDLDPADPGTAAFLAEACASDPTDP